MKLVPQISPYEPTWLVEQEIKARFGCVITSLGDDPNGIAQRQIAITNDRSVPLTTEIVMQIMQDAKDFLGHAPEFPRIVTAMDKRNEFEGTHCVIDTDTVHWKFDRYSDAMVFALHTSGTIVDGLDMDKFCSFCGVAHVAKSYPKTCVSCSEITYFNPKPVAVLLQPVTDGTRTGVLIGRRGIEPKRGEFGLVGGYIDPSDADVVAGACREYHEETGLPDLDPSYMELERSFSDGRFLLIFVRNPIPIHVDDLSAFKVNYECTELDVAWEPQELCFASHTAALARFDFGRVRTEDIV